MNKAGLPLLRIVGDASLHALRSLLRHRAFNLTVIAILSLGVGATAAMVSVIDALLFRAPAHVQQLDRLVQVVSAGNYPQYQELTQRSRALDAAAYTRVTLTLGHGEAAQAIETQCVTASYFSVLGARPVAGRAFVSTDDGRGAPPTVVLSFGLWRRAFAGDAAIVGRSVSIAGTQYTVIGVAPPDFRGIEMAAVDAWILLAVSPAVCSFAGRDLLASSSGSWLTVIGRLSRDITLAQAEEDVRGLALRAMENRVNTPPAPDDVRGLAAQAMANRMNTPPVRELEPIAESRRNRAGRDGRIAVWVATGAGLVLLIACANVAGLLAVRAIERRREIAVRLQLGASRGRVFMQLVAENVALAGASVGAAWLVAGWIGSLLRGFFPAVLHDAWFDSRTIAVLSAFALGAGVLAGVVPSAQTARGDTTALWRSGQTLGQARSRFRNGLLIAQIALALVLAVGAGLFARSVRAAKSGLGYDLDRVVVALIDLERAGIRRQAEQRPVFDRILANVRQLPQIEAASLTTASPLGSGQFIMVLPKPMGRLDALTRHVNIVSPDYFKTVGTRIVAGRSFTEADTATSPAVAILDTGLARELWPGEQVVGRCMQIVLRGRPCVEIVGLSEPRRMGSLTRVWGEIFYPLAQAAQDGTSVPQAVLVRPRESAADVQRALGAAIRSAAPNLPFVDVRTLDDLANVQARSWRLGAMLFGLFGAAAIVLAAVGVYASLAFAVRQRTAEIGVRLALGAEPGAIAGMVLRQGMRLVVLGAVLGLGASLVLGRSIASLLFGVVPTDVPAFSAAAAIVAVSALAGCLLPAIRAAHVDPVVALRTD